MSYREIRNFVEIMKILGYPRLISMENFRKPNFPLMAECLQWLVVRYDGTIDLPLEIDTEQERVMFVTSAALFMVIKSNIKLNTKKLYMADGHCVRELYKIAHVLHTASKMSQQSRENANDDDEFDFEHFQSLLAERKASASKKSRRLASDLTQNGAVLYDHLKQELELRERRAFVLSKQIEMSELESGLRAEIKAVSKQIESTNYKIENVASDEANLDAKIEKKRAELQRHQKRLQALKSVRPAFMDEFEKLEQQLIEVYNAYILKFRCLVFLEQQLEDVERQEHVEKLEHEEQIQKMIETMRDDQLLVDSVDGVATNGIEHDFDDADSDGILAPNNVSGGRRGTINTTTAKRSTATGRVRAESQDDGDLKSDFEIDGDDALDDDLDSDLDDMELMNLTTTGDDEVPGNGGATPQPQGSAVMNGQRPPPAPGKLDADASSDDDF